MSGLELPEELVIPARSLMREATWTFAASPKMRGNPHWYLVHFAQRGDPRWDALMTLAKKHSVPRTWHGQRYKALDLDDWSMWAIWPVLNAKPMRYAGWDGDPVPPAGWLPEEWHRDLHGLQELPL